MTSIPLPVAEARRFWGSARLLGVVLTVVLLAWLVVAPVTAAHALWNLVIPILPATFLVSPMLWRNVCPLATLNEFTGSRGPRAAPSVEAMRAAWWTGVVLLFVMVPARRFLFNENGHVLAATIAVVGVLAVAGGLRYARRSGFCGSICPVLPVEKLYGQAPLAHIGSARCAECTGCTPVGCIDLANSKAVPQTLGRSRRDASWLRTSFGVFAASFPGFILGYFLASNGDLSTAGAVYGRVLGLAAVSYVVVAGIVWASGCSSSAATLGLGALAIGLYYWLAAPTLVESYHVPAWGVGVVRVVAVLGAVSWVWRAVRGKARGLDGPGPVSSG